MLEQNTEALLKVGMPGESLSSWNLFSHRVHPRLRVSGSGLPHPAGERLPPFKVRFAVLMIITCCHNAACGLHSNIFATLRYGLFLGKSPLVIVSLS